MFRIKLLPSVFCETSKTIRLKILQFFYSLTSKVRVLVSSFFLKKKEEPLTVLDVWWNWIQNPTTLSEFSA